MGCFIFDRFAAVWTPGVCELYLADITIVDQLRTHDLQHVGLPAESMRSLWQEARKVCVRADLFNLPELTHSPFLIFLDGQRGAVLGRWESLDSWAHLVTQLREVRRAA